MPQVPVQLSIPEPCQANWDAMTASETGRHCDSCRKHVVDFTVMTDIELADYLRRSPGFGCGRFRADQLGRPLQPRVLQRPRYAPLLARIAASAALLLGLGAPAAAQFHFGRKSRSGKAAGQEAGKPPATIEPAMPCIRLRGTVYNAGGSIAPGAKLELYWESRVVAAATTDSCGNYELTTDLEIPAGTKLLTIINSGSQTARMRYEVGMPAGSFVIKLAPVQFNLNQPRMRDIHFMGFVVQHPAFLPPPPKKSKYQLKL